MSNVERYVDSALALNPRLPGAYAARGFARAFIAWDFPDGERNLREAVRLSPSFATAHQWIASVIDVQGRHDEALAEYRLAKELDPLSSIIATDLAMGLFGAGRFAESAREYQKVMEQNPRFPEAFRRAAWLYAATGRDSLVADALERWNELQSRPMFRPGALRSARDTGGGRAMYALLVDAGRAGGGRAVDLALWHVRLDQKAPALDLLEEAADQRDIWLAVGLGFPLFTDLEHEPRYQALVRRVFGR